MNPGGNGKDGKDGSHPHPRWPRCGCRFLDSERVAKVKMMELAVDNSGEEAMVFLVGDDAGGFVRRSC